MKYIFLFLLLFNGWVICFSQEAGTASLPEVVAVTDSIPSPYIKNLSVSIKDNSKGFLKWKVDSTSAESFFAIERSVNGTDFSTVGVSKNSTAGWVEFIDESLVKGKVFYRIKFVSGQTTAYSEIVSVVLSADVSCKFYPNPVDKALIVRSDIGVELQISDQFGKPLINERLQPGLKVIDVSSLEPGIYVITLFQKETNRFITDKLVKK